MLESLTLQYVIVTAIVLIAAVLLAIRASKYFLPGEAKSGCGTGCGSCANHSAATEPKRVELLQLGGVGKRKG